MKVQFYLTDVTYRVLKGKAVVHLYGRTPKGEQVAIHDGSFEPYFFVQPRDAQKAKDDLLALSVKDKRDEYRVVRVEDVTKNVNEHPQKLLKAIVNIPSGVPLLKDEIRKSPAVKECYEYDIKFVRRYLIDKGLEPMTLIEAEGEKVKETSRVPIIKASSVKPASDGTYAKPRILAVDIETYNPLGKRVLVDKHPVIMIALYGENFKKILTWKKFESDAEGIEFLPSEADMLTRFKELIAEYGPDILAGYYSDGFDLPYLIKRAAKYKMLLDIGLDYSELKINGTTQTTVQTTGIVHVDVFKFIKKVIGRGMETDVFTLDAVAEELLGENKHDVNLDILAKCWDDASPKLDEFAKYNLQDAKLTHDLCLKILPDMIEFVKVIGLPLWDVNRMTFSQFVEWYLIKQAEKFNEVVLNRPTFHQQQGRMMARFKGALVFEPKPGLYDNIVVFDYRSLYPSIIASHNISPGTMNITDCKRMHNVPLDGEKYTICLDRKGFLSTVIEDIIVRRAEIKAQLKKQAKQDPLLRGRSEALKVLANSVYGYLGFAPARWYSFEAGQSVTAYGRHYITKVIDAAQKAGFTVLYSDTDSVFLMLGTKTEKDAMAFMEEINKELPGLMELDYENFYPRGVFVSTKSATESGAKKKYALIDRKGSLKIRGFETVRRNTAFIAKDVQKGVLQMVLGEGKPEKAIAYVKEVIADLKQNKVPLEKVVIWTQLTKDPREYESVGPHVAAAKRMQERGTLVGPGDIIKYVVTRGKGKIRDRVKLEDEATQDEYDSDYYIENQVLPAVERILAVFGVSTDELEKKGTQSTLGSW